MSKKFELMKVFDCHDMSKDVKSSFYDCTDGIDNDCYVNWYVGDYVGSCEDLDNKEKEVLERYQKVDQWLIKHGAEDKEKVIIWYSW